MTATAVLVLRIGLAIILYLFLWQVLQTLWQELNQQGTFLSSRKKPGIHLDAKMENNKEAGYHFRQAEIVIGRGLHCDISMADEALSANHVRVSFHHGQWWLEDLGSTNGTFLNKNKIAVPTVIITGDQFKCGNTVFSVRIDLLESKFPSTIQNDTGGTS